MTVRVLLLLAVESFCFALVCLPACLLIVNTNKGIRIALRRMILLLIVVFMVLVGIDIVGTYIQKSSFTGIFIITKNLWLIAISYYFVRRIMCIVVSHSVERS